jgi:formylglycine-generating enzyme
VLAVSAFALGAACGVFDTAEAPTDADGGPTDGGPSLDAGAPDAAPGDACPSGRGPHMVLVEIPGGARFCIDATEATRGQYKEFLDHGLPPLPANQPAECAGNTSYGADDISLADTDLPVGGVDWCDALAFCAWAGKRLCGALGDGGVLTRSESKDPQRSEWTAACSKSGTRAYPYGQDHEVDACHSPSDAAPIEVGKRARCEGGYPGIFDMVGNVAEWENACDAVPFDAGDRCSTRGGNWRDDRSCYQNDSEVPTTSGASRGIRCCATPQ